MDLTKIVILVVVGLIILVTLLGEFRPRRRRRPGPSRSAATSTPMPIAAATAAGGV